MADEKSKPVDKPAAEQPKPTPPTPALLDVDYAGGKGSYTFYIQVTTAQGVGIQTRIIVVEGEGGGKTRSTDEHGYLEHTAMVFQEEERGFLFRVHGTTLEKDFTLSGPEKPPEPPREKTKPIASAGFWANLKNVLKNQG